jgi:hypothetical protein
LSNDIFDKHLYAIIERDYFSIENVILNSSIALEEDYIVFVTGHKNVATLIN